MHRAWGSCHPPVPVKVAALPSIDVFLPGHNLESLEELSRILAS